MEDIACIADMLHSRISKLEIRAGCSRPRMTCYLGKQLRPVVVDDDLYSIVGDGDDGVVIKANKETCPDGEVFVYKIFKCVQVDDEYSRARNEVVREQALREFNALKMIKDHPNFLRLYSSELDTCELTDLHAHFKECYAIQLNYLSNLTYMKRSFDLLGIQYDAATKVAVMNYDHRNKLVKFVLVQTFSMLSHLEKLGINHRDLDSCNFMMKLPELKPYIFDFSRASLPHYMGLEDTADLDVKYDQIKKELEILKRSKRNKTIVSKMDILQYKLLQYASPVQEFSDFCRVTDKFMCKFWIDRALQRHVSLDQWISGETESIENQRENTLIEDFVDDAWIEGTDENTQIKSGNMARPFDSLFLLSIAFKNLGTTKRDTEDKKERINTILEQPRQVVHSAEFIEYTSDVATIPPTFLTAASEGDAKVAKIGLSNYTLSILRYYSSGTKTIYDIIIGIFLTRSRDRQKMLYYLTCVLEIFPDEAEKVADFAQTESQLIVAL
jgi:hypothetical protein